MFPIRNAAFAIDGSHIPIPSLPGRDMAAYFNCKGFYSVILLAIVDNAELFRWISARPPGSSGDASVWKWCKLSKEIVDNQSLPEPQRKNIFRDRYARVFRVREQCLAVDPFRCAFHSVAEVLQLHALSGTLHR